MRTSRRCSRPSRSIRRSSNTRRSIARPHALVHFLRDLANTLHTYYNAEQFIVEEAALRNARLTLVLAVQQVIRNGLGILGVSAPETM